MKATAESEIELGELLQRLVNRISHRLQGKSFAIMNDASVTVPQVILLYRVIHEKLHKPSELARSLGMSGPAVSQMLDRLFQLDLIARLESPKDRRQRLVTATPKAKALCARIANARSAEYAQGVAHLSAPLRAEFNDVLARVLGELDAADAKIGCDDAADE
ncbi:MarR family winged helix-turn-helix transcriptional regulator [Methylovirgula sp. HY1]|uniref:MarR family winged helix-turn-helix transcriptional regulator n=1 Tax=Methylovirgula sp. HY1 TaxID=2822761 RepID=UPI001C5B2E45|nr:MarR family transcriptional regulator [Methylovirgula sp. HY1]QXX74854.1 HTH-type transcriptional regulator MgrA [Methylovirgula sp. HY1]